MRSSVFAKRAVSALTLMPFFVSGCYVIPLDHAGRPSGGHAYAPLPMPVTLPVNLVAKLYPANSLASGTGILVGSVTNQLNGHGTFSVTMGGDRYEGEATRSSGNDRQGIANAAGSRGNFVRCQYTMNNTSQGTGECEFSNGAKYTLHVGA